VDGRLKDSLESGNWAFYDQKKVLLSKGNYNNGLKEGDWFYLVDSAEVNLSWSTFLNDTVKFAINYPSKWNIITDKKYLFRATFNDVDTSKGKYLLVSEITNDTTVIRSDEYSKQVISLVNKHFTVHNQTRLVIKNDNRKIYFNKLDIIRNSKNFAMYEACIDINNTLYDFIYSTDDLTDLPGIIFFNVLQGCFINNTRVINPLYPYIFEKLENE
jgi:3-methyladenine DNA glycosylase AlkC